MTPQPTRGLPAAAECTTTVRPNTGSWSCTSTEKLPIVKLMSAAPPEVEVYVTADQGSVGADTS